MLINNNCTSHPWLYSSSHRLSLASLKHPQQSVAILIHNIIKESQPSIQLVQGKTPAPIWTLKLSPLGQSEYPDGQQSWCPCAIYLGKSVWRCILRLRLLPPQSYMGWVSVYLNLTCGFFSKYSGFPPSPKSAPSQKQPFGVNLIHLSYAFVRSRLSCSLCNSVLGAT